MELVNPDQLRNLYRNLEEFALIDPREEMLFARGHLFAHERTHFTGKRCGRGLHRLCLANEAAKLSHQRAGSLFLGRIAQGLARLNGLGGQGRTVGRAPVDCRYSGLESWRRWSSGSGAR